MKRDEFIAEINRLYDRVLDLERQVEILGEQKKLLEDGADGRLMDYAKDSLWEKCVVERPPSLTVEKVGGNAYVGEGFEDWRKDVIDKHQIPDTLSKADVYEILDGRLRDLYREQTDRAVEEMRKGGE